MILFFNISFKGKSTCKQVCKTLADLKKVKVKINEPSSPTTHKDFALQAEKTKNIPSVLYPDIDCCSIQPVTVSAGQLHKKSSIIIGRETQDQKVEE